MQPAHNAASSSNNIVRQVIQEARYLINPPAPTWALAMLILFMAFRGLLILVALAVIVYPAFKGRASRKKHYFFICQVHSKEFRGVPYLVPNRCMAMIIGELLSSVMFLISAHANYLFYTAPEMPTGTHLPLWYFLTWPPSYIGIWMSGWGLAHACFCNVNDTMKKRPWIPPPHVYNFLWLSWSFLVIMIVVCASVIAIGHFDRMEHMITALLKILNKAAIQFDIDHNIGNIPIVDSIARRDAIYQVLDEFQFTSGILAEAYIALTVVLAVFYVGSVRYLLRSLQKVIVLADSEALDSQGQLTSAIWGEVEVEFRYLSRCSIVISLAIVAQIGAFAFDTWASDHLQKPNVKLFMALVDQLPGLFMAPTLIIQAARIFTERYAADESKFGNILTEFEKRTLPPQMASQLLGWDTTENWSTRPAADVVNFPGLCEVQPNTSLDVRIQLKVTKTNPICAIQVQKTTVITQEEVEEDI